MTGNPRQAIADLSRELCAPAHCGHSWCIVWTAARSERIVARRFAAHGVAYFLPLTRVRREYAGQILHVEVPIFPGCVFAAAPVQTLLNAAAGDDDLHGTARLIRKVRVAPDQAAFRSQLQNLARTLQQQQVPFDQLSSMADLQAEIRLELCDYGPRIIDAPSVDPALDSGVTH